MRDAYGRRRSSRSTPTGPGSRGGHWHEDAFRSQWWRDYNREHPRLSAKRQERREAYRAQRAALEREESNRARLRRVRSDDPGFAAAVVTVVRQEVQRTSVAQVARTLLVERRSINRWLQGAAVISGDGIDAVILTYSLRRIVGEYNRLRHGGAGTHQIAATRLATRAGLTQVAA